MKQAFTLIELLVVVLIIGILSAIALPQYQRAVKRARGAEALTVSRALEDAMNQYYLTNGTYEGITDDSILGISAPKMKNWKYANVGSPGSYDTDGTDSFTGCSRGSSSDWQGCMFSILNADGATLLIYFSKGKRSDKSCYGTDKNCADYFGCKNEQLPAYPGASFTVNTRVCDF